MCHENDLVEPWLSACVTCVRAGSGGCVPLRSSDIVYVCSCRLGATSDAFIMDMACSSSQVDPSRRTSSAAATATTTTAAPMAIGSHAEGPATHTTSGDGMGFRSR